METTYLPIPGSWQDWVSVIAFGVFVAFIGWQIFRTKPR